MNFDIRKQLLEYDNVMNKQREMIYTLRNQILEGADLRKNLESMIEETLEEKLGQWTPVKEIPENWDINALHAWMTHLFSQDGGLGPAEWAKLSHAEIQEKSREVIDTALKAREAELGTDIFLNLQRMVLLQTIDVAWKEHLYDLDQLKKGITLRAYAQKDPLIEFQREAFNLFSQMMNRIREQTLEYLFKMQLAGGPEGTPDHPQVPSVPAPRSVFAKARAVKPEFEGPTAPPSSAPSGVGSEIFWDQTQKRGSAPLPSYDDAVSEKPKPISVPAKIGRNDPCPCGSGKKYKKCHGQ
jgi:preprotein translocase subunit SecA